MKRIVATDFYNYTKCKYLVYLEKNGDQKSKDRVSDFVKMLWYRGIQHEKEIIEKIAKDKNKNFAEVDKNKKANQETFEQTLELMKRGVDYIYQGVLISDNYIGRPDLMEKVDGKSIFGNYYYIPIDIKAGRGYEGEEFDDERTKLSYKLQITFYALLLGKIQAYQPEMGKIINIDKEELEYKLDTQDEKFVAYFQDIELMARGEELYQPTISGKCGMCQWKTYCKNWADKNKDLSLIYYLGEQKYGLQSYGINSYEDLLKHPLGEWLDILPTAKKQGYFKGIAEKSLTNFYNRALVYISGKEVIYNKIDFPSGSKEIHFDIEDDPTQDIVYMFGFWIIDNGKGYYHAIVAENINGEEKATRELWEFLKINQGIPMYHYSHHEKSTLRRLQEKYSLDPSVYEQFLNDAFDLYSAVTKNTDFPLTSYGLKAICKHLGFHWSAEDAGGANSIEWYSKYLAGDKSMMDKILKYNEEDCKATAYLKDYLIYAK
ncbi:MAG: TM0106 family RecB-like putative nuclease [Patescibacteria group bacterium]